MEVVAQFLRGHATGLPIGLERDLFGRSAFNRFYYAAFLNVRKDLIEAIPNLPSKHAGIPEFLRGTVRKELVNGATRARRADDLDLVDLCSRAKSAALDLANLMEEGYSTRVLADYYPERPVVFDIPGNFSLNNVAVGLAQAWPHKATAFARTIADAWRQLSV